MSTFDYELNFTNDYDENVIDNSSVPDKDDIDFKNEVIAKINQLKLIKQLQPGIANLSSYVDFNASRYKISLT
jgi:hypothetical protein